MLYKQLKKIWDSYNEKTSLNSSEPLDSSLYTPLLNIARSSKMIVAIYNFKAFKSDFISDNLEEILGISVKDHDDKGGKLFVDNIIDDHKKFAVILSQTLQENLLKLGKTKCKYSTVCCGLTYNHPEKGIIRLLNKQYISEFDENNHPVKAIFTTHDITPLLKDDSYWIQFNSESDNVETHTHYRSATGEKYGSSIISRREKEILILIAQGQETDEIAGSLYISRNTVNNHRQNMLNRLGIKDTSALVYLARLCELI